MKLPNFKNVIAKIQEVRFHILGAIFAVVVIAIVAVGERTSILNARKIAFSDYEKQTKNLLTAVANEFISDENYINFVANDPEIIKFLEKPSTVLSEISINDYLASINNFRESSTLYILDKTGLCLASTDETFLGNNYGFRQYFYTALDHGHAFSVAMGITSNVLGFYHSSVVKNGDETLGVVVTKISPDEVLEKDLLSESGTFYVMTDEGVVFYSTEKGDMFFWESPTQEMIAKIESGKQFNLKNVSSSKFVLKDSSYVDGTKSYIGEDGTEYIFSDNSIGDHGHVLRIIRLAEYDFVIKAVAPVLNLTYVLSTITTVTTIAFLVILFYFIKSYRKQFTVRQELTKAEKTLSSLIDKLPIGITKTTIKGEFTFLNPRALKMFGFRNIADAKKHPVSDLYVNLKDRKNIISSLKTDGFVENQIVELYDARKNKKVIRASIWLNDTKDGLETTFEDITESITVSERFKSVALSVSDCIWELDKGGQFTFCSENVYQLLGYKTNDLLGKTFCDFMLEEDCARFKREFGEAVSKKKPIKGLSYEFKTKSGGSIFLEVNGVPILDSAGKLVGYRGASKDLTQILEQRESLELLTSAVEQSATTVVITDLDGNIEYVNAHFEDLTGYKKEEVLGKNPKILNSGYHDMLFYKNLWDTILSGKTFKGKIRNRKKDGSIFWEDSTITPIRSSGGQITHFMAIKEDITNQMALEEERTLYQQITKNIGDELYLIDDNEGFAFVNEAVLLSSGYDAGTFMKLNLKDLEVDYVKGVWSKRLENLKNAGNSENLEVTFYSKNRDRQIKELTIRSLNYKGRPHLLATGRDVTKRREEEEIQKEKTYEIQKLNELTTGREYKIIELQNKLEKLEKLVGKYKKYFDK